ncbi:MAG: redoxin domain-containing protein [Gemmatimonadetes bacterium]|nr:redoxin domain-containing protein [Gemmatimonadota bacterium]
MKRLVTATVATVLLAGSVQAQERPLRAGVLGSPTVGKPAPDVVLPYFLPTGPGPTDQPFRLSAELGRVVVLVLGGGLDSASRAGWREVAERARGLGGRSVVVAGVVRAGAEAVLGLSVGLDTDLKLLADPDGRVHRTYGLGRGGRVWAGFVVADDGRLVWSGRLELGSEVGWKDLAAAVEQGRTARLPSR